MARLFRAPFQTMSRLIQLWRIQGRLDLLWVTRDLLSVLLYLVSETVLSIGAVTATFLLAERFDGIGAWSRAQILFMLGYALLVTAIPNTFFGFNITFISRRIGRGQLDHLLIQPRPLWMALATEGVAPFSDSFAMLPGIGLMLWAGVRLPLTPSLPWLLLLALNLLASSAIVLAFSYLWSSLAFWAPLGAEEVSSSALQLVSQLKGFPLTGAGPLLLGGLLTIVPVGFVAWYPCRALLGLDTMAYARWLTPLAALLLGGAAIAVFHRGMQQYGRTGSQRYLSRGHRR